MQKGGARVALYELCKRLLWPLPTFESELRVRVEDEAARAGFSALEVTGDPRLDKRSSQDSAALLMLFELQKQGTCRLKEL
ncbi:unnamed protein product [Spirodela intermedia]|uniref:Uncharacterized protein n=1 Tax=Spirodela intermedia TaxID=51605 RepID=A0A7I8IV98_SPIIN|nr:unnamed protein product [Spirodela intermedia]CAA6660914.1 unnamed protein product [Spirodela intermedia]